MSYRNLTIAGMLSALVLSVLTAVSVSAAPGAARGQQHAFSLTPRGSTVPIAGRTGRNLGVQHNDMAPEVRQGERAQVNRSLSRRPVAGRTALPVPVVPSTAVTTSNPGLKKTFEGLNHNNQRFANGGNQFSLEPPDQGLCVGNGFVLETVNDVMRVFDMKGNPLIGVVDLNTFYGYPAQYNRTTGKQGPFVTDPSCYYDGSTQRWYHVVLTLNVNANTGAFPGPNHLDIAVSQTSDPTGAWTLYTIPVQDDGSQGTPNHGCSGGPCIGDYPHIGADQYGFFITTNEYSLFGPEYIAAQLYAMSKSALAAGGPVTVSMIENLSIAGNPGFTVWPATAPSGKYNGSNGGTEYFLSSMAAEEAGNTSGFDNRVGLWTLTNTSSLDSTPALALTNAIVDVETYGVPPKSDQKAGDVPLATCLNNDCLGFGPPPSPEVESVLDSSDSRMLQVWYAKGTVMGALDTILNVGGQDRAGIAWFMVKPTRGGARLMSQGYLATAGQNVTYPAIATMANGVGAMAFTLTGQDWYPSAAYAPISVAGGVGDIHVISPGVGPQDGFSGYFIGGPRPRWGDYGAAVSDGRTIWMASEAIAQTCTYATYLSDTSCGGTRSALANWSTRVSRLAP